MPKTKRDLIHAVSDKIGGESGAHMRAAFEKPLFKNLRAWDQILTDEEFASQLQMLENNLRKARLLKKGEALDDPKSWGLPN